MLTKQTPVMILKLRRYSTEWKKALLKGMFTYVEIFNVETQTGHLCQKMNRVYKC